jgi:hypothetical protein
MKRETQSESERAQTERMKLAEREQPTIDPAATCNRCFGSGTEIVKVDGYNTARSCNHEPLENQEDIPF